MCKSTHRGQVWRVTSHFLDGHWNLNMLYATLIPRSINTEQQLHTLHNIHYIGQRLTVQDRFQHKGRKQRMMWLQEVEWTSNPASCCCIGLARNLFAWADMLMFVRQNPVLSSEASTNWNLISVEGTRTANIRRTLNSLFILGVTSDPELLCFG